MSKKLSTRQSKFFLILSVYDVNAVFNVVKILDMLFKEHEKKKQVSDFVNKFDYNLLKFSIKATLDIDHSLSVGKFIWLYYRNAHIMNIGHLGEVFSQVFFRSCYKLFFHWSWQVRNIFYYFIVFVVGFRLKKMDFRNNREERGMRRNSISDGNEIENYAEEVKTILTTRFKDQS